MGHSRLVPFHWTKINSEADAQPRDDLYVDDANGTIYVRGEVAGNTTVDEIASTYNVSTADVIFPLKKKR